MGIQNTAVVTGAKVHDSEVAIPMEKLTASRDTHLSSLMDCAHDAADIRSWISACERKATTKANRRGRETAQAMDPATRRRYAIRAAVE
jgi:hypothetical protein